MNNGQTPWCSLTSNYDVDKRWGNCAGKNRRICQSFFPHLNESSLSELSCLCACSRIASVEFFCHSNCGISKFSWCKLRNENRITGLLLINL